jgi:ABC-2 type transport system permease protein
MATAGIFLTLLGGQLRARLQYRVNFVLWFVVGVAFNMTGFFFLWALLSRFQALGGWSLEEIVFLYGLRLLTHSFAVMAFGGIQLVDYWVSSGDLDVFLVRPFSPLLNMLSWFHVPGLGDFVGGIVLFVVAMRIAPVDLSPIAILYLVLVIIGGTLLEGAMRVAAASLSFRFMRTGALLGFVDSVFNNFGNLPLRIFGGAVEVLLTYVLPVAFVAYIPASVVLGRTAELSVQPVVAYFAPLVGVVLFAASLWLWHHELPRYQSSGT